MKPKIMSLTIPEDELEIMQRIPVIFSILQPLGLLLLQLEADMRKLPDVCPYVLQAILRYEAIFKDGICTQNERLIISSLLRCLLNNTHT
jgi:hypothetical protein